MKKIIIAGAGIAGLSFAYECLLRKHEVLLVEADSTVGGLCRTVQHNDCLLDLGSHILYLKDQQVFQRVKQVVSDDQQWIKIKREGKIYVHGNYVDWPLRSTAVFQLPLGFSLKVLYDQLFLKASQAKLPANYEEELLTLYGPTLYYAFFEPLTKRFSKTEPRLIHSDWAFSSLRAATKIEDKTFSESYKYLANGTDTDSKKHFNAITFFLRSLKTKREDEPFYYFKDGFRVLTNAYRDAIVRLGGKIITNTSIDSFAIEGDTVKQCVVNGEKLDVDLVVWTGKLSDVCSLVDIDCSRMDYLHSKFVYFFLNRCNKNHQVCYYADSDISFLRGTILSNISKTIIRNKNVSALVCLEYTFKTQEEMNSSFECIKRDALRDLKKIQLIDDESAIESVFEINAPFSYPLLTLQYKENLARLQKQLARYKNIVNFGRQATFDYDNVDLVIKEAINHPLFVQELR